MAALVAVRPRRSIHPVAAGPRRTPGRGGRSSPRRRAYLLQAASYLVIGAGGAAALHVLVPASVFERLSANLVAGILVMALLVNVRCTVLGGRRLWPPA